MSFDNDNQCQEDPLMPQSKYRPRQKAYRAKIKSKPSQKKEVRLTKYSITTKIERLILF